MAFTGKKKTPPAPAPAPSAAPPARGLDRAWEAGDSIPAPEAIEGDGDTAWALWNEVANQEEVRFAETAPMTSPPNFQNTQERGWAKTEAAGSQVRLPPVRRREQPLFTLEGAMLVARRNNRVCPRPDQWNALTALLPERKTPRGTQQPPAPATGEAWAVTPALTKRLCFREQIEWAEREGVLETVMAFMQRLKEDEWLHMGEE
ncbi:hypothetical protein [Ramlibacter pallidus]|uniref:Uncharacterized protein n=1 Tax=Ramlibacter pallidus TaxID=2780087 RepID=A0ABR9S565_9BURK|nr:hypothetical protein [Ramlibacter pallidus]MBE7368653.1 hypothetical protein [Ramlibacter pallidus]